MSTPTTALLSHTSPTQRKNVLRVGLLAIIGLTSYWSTVGVRLPGEASLYARHLSSQIPFINTLQTPPIACASPWNPTLPVDSPLQHDPTDCHPIDSILPDFSLSICASPTACNSFTVRIARVDQTECARMESRSNMTNDQKVLRYIKEELGPDSFLIRTSGSQRWASELSRYDGGCEYRFDVSLSNGGDVWLELWHNFANYDAFDEEDTRDWAPLLHQPLLAEPLRLTICSPTCPSYYSARLKETDSGSSFTTLASSSSSPDTLVFDPVDLPPCGDHAEPEGLYLPWHPMDKANPPAPLIQARGRYNQSVVGNYNYVPATCSLKHAGNQFRTDHTGCTSKKADVGFFGDSHSRFILHGWQYRLAGNTDFYPEKQKEVYARSAVTYDQSTYHFMWAPYSWSFYDVKPEEWQALSGLVVSHGAWASMEGSKTSAMLAGWEKVVDYIEESTKDHPIKNKVFMTPAPYPPQNAPSRRERRTNVWIGYWNMRLKEMMTSRGWKVLDQYTLGMPMMMEMLGADGLHLSPSEVHSTLVDLVMLQTDIC